MQQNFLQWHHASCLFVLSCLFVCSIWMGLWDYGGSAGLHLPSNIAPPSPPAPPEGLPAAPRRGSTFMCCCSLLWSFMLHHQTPEWKTTMENWVLWRPCKKAAVKHSFTAQPCGTFDAFSLDATPSQSSCQRGVSANYRCWPGVVRKADGFAVYHVFLHPCRGGCIL